MYCVSASLDGAVVLAGSYYGGVYDLSSGQRVQWVTSTDVLYGVALLDPSDGLAVGQGGPRRYDGANWHVPPPGDPIYPPSGGVLDVAVEGGGYIGVTTDGAVIRYDDEAWAVLGQPVETPLYDVDVSPDGGVWAMGTFEGNFAGWRSVIVHQEGGEWTTDWDVTAEWSKQVVSIGAVSQSEAWTVGPGGAWHYEAGAWTRYETPPLFAVAVVARDEVWAAAEHDATFYRWDGTDWREAYSADRGGWIRRMYTAADKTVWAGGSDGVVWRYSPADGWRMVRDPQSALDTRSGTVWASYGIAVVGDGATQEVFAVGGSDTVLRATWIRQARLFLPRVERLLD